MRRLQHIASILLVALVVSSCARGDDEAQDRQAELLGFADISDPDSVFEQFERENLRVQERIVECMAAAGFDYLPVEPAVPPAAGGGLTAEEYKERYGWGYMSSIEETLADTDVGDDPNASLRDGMDQATLTAWETQLYGPPGSSSDPATREGCQAEAERQVFAYQETHVWAELEPLLWEIPERVLADPRMADADRDWSRCMAEAGYHVADIDELFDHIDEVFFDTWERQTPPPGEPEVENRYLVHEWFVGTDAWYELVEFELEAAAADDACSQGVDADLLAEYQQRFLEEHQDLLQQLQAEVAGLSK